MSPGPSMESLLYLPVIITGVALCLFSMERYVPLRRASHPVLRRLIINLCISGLAFGLAALSIRPIIAPMLQWVEEQPVGLLHLLDMPLALRSVLAFLLLDVSFYYWHVANHKVPLLWRFHNAHHIDPDLDVTTAFRFHAGEILLSTGFRAAQILLIGVSAGIYLSYEVIFQAATLFHHSNVRLPIAVERLLNRVVVTPRMHGIHHSQVRGETNSNYSVVLSWWDRLHRTLRLNIPQAQIAIGIPGYTRAGDNTLWNALIMPLRRQRDYWRKPDGTTVERQPTTIQGDRRYLAE
jgi:sterol desaturase/sphingolipid hydroxylase (fatty acid hydroxylase superfamily)